MIDPLAAAREKRAQIALLMEQDIGAALMNERRAA